jgi:hypothetical protein
MERLQKPQASRERTGIIQIVLIAAVLLAALYGGLRLLGGTRASWEARKQERAQHAAEIREAVAQAQRDENQALKDAGEQRLRDYEREISEGMKSGRFKCVSGVLFRRIPNGWENVPGEHCRG